jgi:hypothetical protein
MELIYENQDLVAWQLNHSFNEVVNTEVIRPSWKARKTYGDTFFIKKRKWINESLKNIPTWNIVDSIIIDEVEYLLIFNWLTIDIAYDDWTNYVSMWLIYPRWEYTPYKFAKWYSWTWEIFSWITIEDVFIDKHYAWIWNPTIEYELNAVVTYSWVRYIAISNDWAINLNMQPDTETDFWKLYVTNESWYNASDPSSIEYRDVYVWSYLKLKLKKTNIRDLALIWRYLLFSSIDSNLQWVNSYIHYTETTYVNYYWSTDSLPSDEIYVYIRWTNSIAIRPYITEEVLITTENAEIPIIATETKIISLHLKKSLWEIIWAVPIVLYEALDWDYIKDIVWYNWVNFVLTKNKILYSQIWSISNINFFALDVFLNLWKLNKLVPFWKTLIIFWTVNWVITSVVSTEWTEWYVYNELKYNWNLHSKYSVISSMWSLYVLQDDKQFLQVDIYSDNNIDYNVTLTNAIPWVRWLFDFIVWEVFICEYNKQIYVLDKTASETYYYKYDIEYKHWNTWDYLNAFYKIEDKLYWDWLFEFNNNYFDNTEDYREQVISFSFWGDALTTLTQVYFVKIIFWLNELILDYELEVEYQLGWIIHKVLIDLKNYPINLEIGSWDAWLWDSNLNTTLIGTWIAIDTVAIWNFVSVTVWLWLTGSVFNFKIKSKNNGFIYWGSTIWYINKIPTVTEYNYKH